MKTPDRNKRSIILGGVAVAAILLWVFAIMPFFDRISQREQDIESNVNLIRRYTAALEEGAQPSGADADMYRRMQEIEGRLFKGQTVQLAAADIQRIVDAVARQSALRIRTVRVLDSESLDAFVEVPIQVIFESDLTRTTGFIDRVENHRKLLTIPELQIRVRNRRQPREITVTMKIAGYMKKEDTES